MGRLLYSAIASLDGYVADDNGDFQWGAPDEEVHGFVNDLERPIGTYLYGRRMYEVMRFWEDPAAGGRSVVSRDFGEVWRAADKVVFSRTLEVPSTAKTRLERSFDPAAVRAMKADVTRDLTVGGPCLAGEAFRAGLVDECHLFLTPILVGGGNSALPDGVRTDLELLGERRFASGVVHLHYRVNGLA
ncbi:MAG TPA: dihydrofolate reductase family protein [Mycobacteriales bacterium]|nr:dihydrofolate reductase family protein [Mycobacteriales bacterium]